MVDTSGTFLCQFRYCTLHEVPLAMGHRSWHRELYHTKAPGFALNQPQTGFHLRHCLQRRLGHWWQSRKCQHFFDHGGGFFVVRLRTDDDEVLWGEISQPYLQQRRFTRLVENTQCCESTAPQYMNACESHSIGPGLTGDIDSNILTRTHAIPSR